jgi:chromatin remodeling complex protein RSC6
MEEIANDFQELNNVIKNFKLELNNIQQKIKKLEKKVNKENKKHIKKKKRKPSGFAKPQRLSNELCEFLNIENNSKMSRTEVTKKLIKYIKDNNLHESNKILLDEKLDVLFDGSDITFFTLQKHMNKHYIL